MANVFNPNKPRSQKRGGPKRNSRHAAQVAKSRAKPIGPPTASNSKSGVLYVHTVSKKKLNKKSRNSVYKKQRQVAEAMEKEGEVEMTGSTTNSTSIISTRKAERKAAIAAEGHKIADGKALTDADVETMEIDEDEAL